jgi:hypothetical protein
MEEAAKSEEERWTTMMDNIDLLFSKVQQIDRNQQKFEGKFDMTTKVIEQMLKDQQLMSKQIELTGQVVAQLRLDRMHTEDDTPPSPTDSETTNDNPFFSHKSTADLKKQFRPGEHSRNNNKGYGGTKGFLPKMNFPRFSGKKPCYLER